MAERKYPSLLEIRGDIAAKFVRGNVVEIGALGLPTPVPPELATVRYVDKDVQEVAGPWYGQALEDTVALHAVDDCAVLRTVADDSIDAIIACHVMEHCEDFMGALCTHLRKIHRGGVLYYILPDQPRSCDKDRSITSFRHILEDFKSGGRASEKEHEELRVQHGYPPHSGSEGRFHLHVWDSIAMLDLFNNARLHIDKELDYQVEYFEVLQGIPEVVIVLRKR
jgi:hypothetical protein